MVPQLSQCCSKSRTVLDVLFSVYFRKGVFNTEQEEHSRSYDFEFRGDGMAPGVQQDP